MSIKIKVKKHENWHIMIAGTLISNSIVPLRTSDTGEEALSIMRDFSITHLPIVNNKQLLGVVAEEDIINNNIEEAVGSYDLSLRRFYIKEDDHIYEIMRLIGEHHLTIIPVVDYEGNYKGLVTQDRLIQFFSEAASFTYPGSIIVLEVARRDYSLSEISRIVESEGAAILSSIVTSNLDNSVVDVTLKINKQEIYHLIATFERFNYKIKGTFQESQEENSLQERYEAFLAYLNV